MTSYNTTKFSGDGTLVYVYKFSATVRNVYDYQSYPFDADIIEIMVFPEIAFSSVDQYARQSYTPAWGDWETIPGTDIFLLSDSAQELVGFHTEKCEWAYSIEDAYSTGGSEALRNHEVTLKLNVYIKRNTFSASIVDWVYLMVVTLFMYIFICVLSGKRAKSKKFSKHQYSLPFFVGALVSLIFAIISSHQSLRALFPSTTTLLDFMYIFVYVIVALIACAGFQYFIGKKVLDSQFFWPIKIVYWPLVTTIMLGTAAGIYVHRLYAVV